MTCDNVRGYGNPISTTSGDEIDAIRGKPFLLLGVRKIVLRLFISAMPCQRCRADRAHVWLFTPAAPSLCTRNGRAPGSGSRIMASDLDFWMQIRCLSPTRVVYACI